MLGLPSLLFSNLSPPLMAGTAPTKAWIWPSEGGIWEGVGGERGCITSCRPELSSGLTPDFPPHCWVFLFSVPSQSHLGWAKAVSLFKSEDTEHLWCAWVFLGPAAAAVNRTDHACSLPLWKKTDTDERGKPFWDVTAKDRIEAAGRGLF